MADKCKRCGACQHCGAAPQPVYPVYPMNPFIYYVYPNGVAPRQPYYGHTYSGINTASATTASSGNTISTTWSA